VLEEAHAKWSMCYFLDDDYKYTRISTRGNLYLYEFTGNVSKEEIVKYLPKDARVKDYYVDEYGIIITNKNNIPPERVRFLGRFSQWEHSIKMQDVIKISKWFYDFNFIWTRQKSFSSKRLDFNLLDNIDEKEKETQLMLLHLLCELSEILGETNYKKHKQKHDINKEKIREEIIDSFKYLLNIALVWDISCEDFVKEFNRKSDIVEDRYKKEMENKK
jgi:NTP pyrophosphatase (non-canonical NTP hydrolase)